MADTHTLPEPIELEIPGFGAQTFQTFEEISEWVSQEIEAWNVLQDDILHERVTSTFASRPKEFIVRLGEINSLAERGRNAKDDGIRKQAYSQLREPLNGFQKGEYPYSKTPCGQLILKIWEKDPNLAAAMLAFMRRALHPSQEVDTSIRAGALLAVHREGMVESSAEEKQALVALRDDFNRKYEDERVRMQKAAQEFEQLNDQWDQQHETIVTALETIRELNEKEMQRIQDRFEIRMTLAAPRKFWNRKRWTHVIIASWTFIGFAALVAFGVWVAEEHGPILLDRITSKNEGVNLGGAALITLPALAGFWLLRLVSRVFVSNLAGMADAGERATMIETFLALMADKDQPIRKEERLLILHAIFRPGPGVSGDDAPPPNLLEILQKATGKGNGK